MKLKPGDKVRITACEQIYSFYDNFAEHVHAKKWKENNNAENGETGVIKAIHEHLDSPSIDGLLALVDMGDKEIIIGIKGLELVKPKSKPSKPSRITIDGKDYYLIPVRERDKKGRWV